MVDYVSNFLAWYNYSNSGQWLLAVFVLLIAPFIANFFGNLVKVGFKKVKLEMWLKDHELHDSVAGISPIAVLVTLVKISIFLIILNFIASDLLKFEGTGLLLTDFVRFMFSVIWAVIILSTGLILGDYVGDRIKAAKGILFSGMMALVVEGFIVYLSIVEAFSTLGRFAVVNLLTTLFNGVVYGAALALGLAFGLAFGLGLKDSVAAAAKDRNSDFASFMNRMKKR